MSGDEGKEAALAVLAALDAKSERATTPCGDGDLIWRKWGPSSGEGSPLVLLHGGAGSWAHWVANIDALSQHYTLLIPDMPGFGDSALPPAPSKAEQMATALADGIRTLLPGRRIDLIGFSFGGIVASQVAVELGEQVRFFAPVGSGGLQIGGGLREPLKRWKGLQEPELSATLRFNISVLMLAHDRSIDALAMAAYEHGVKRARVNGRSASQSGLLRENLPKITARIGAIYGTLDGMAGPRLEALREIFATIPGADLRLVEDCGHWVPYEATEAFNRLVVEMLGEGAV